MKTQLEAIFLSFLIALMACNMNPSPKEPLKLDQWSRYHIADLPARAMYVHAADLDGDKDLDIVAGGHWWRNPGRLSETWSQQTIGDPLKNMFLLTDFEGDGDIDIIGTQGIGSAVNRQFAWARNDGKGSFMIYTNIDSCETGDFLQGAAMGDFGKGPQIALSWHKGGAGTYLINVPKEPQVAQWSVELISPVTLKEDLSVGDIDRDGDNDLLLGTVWLRNEGDHWQAFTIGEVTDLDEDAEPDRNDLVDVNGDGRLDAVVALELATPILWFEAPEDPTQPWTRHLIDHVEGQGFSMDCQDFDNDGDPDIVIGEHRGPEINRVLLYENVGGGASWNKHVIDSGPKDEIDHHDGTVAVDLDRDGDLDLISIGWYNAKVWVLENKAIDKK